MKKISFDKFQEIVDLIPNIQRSALMGVERDLKLYVFDQEQLQRKIKLFSDFFKVFQGKWSIDILFSLIIYDQCSFNELKKALNGVSTRTLTDRLRLLEQKGIIKREVKTTSPLRVNYKLSDFGKEEVVLFIPVLVNYLLPPRIKKKYPGINKIQEMVKASVEKETEEEAKEIQVSKMKQKIT
jgi:DNA-binding HxlR family transcriptional regulator